eukprot:m.88334 g.88334  ORF g.88334 m.88334 type:complete len:112 (-) comp13622_c1_seq2:73-408(-)
MEGKQSKPMSAHEVTTTIVNASVCVALSALLGSFLLMSFGPQEFFDKVLSALTCSFLALALSAIHFHYETHTDVFSQYGRILLVHPINSFLVFAVTLVWLYSSPLAPYFPL